MALESPAWLPPAGVLPAPQTDASRPPRREEALDGAPLVEPSPPSDDEPVPLWKADVSLPVCEGPVKPASWPASEEPGLEEEGPLRWRVREPEGPEPDPEALPPLEERAFSACHEGRGVVGGATR